MVTIVGTTGDVRTRTVAGQGTGTVRIFRGGREIARGGGGSAPVPVAQELPVNIVDGQEVAFTPDPTQFEQVGTTPSGGGIFISPVARQSTQIISTGGVSTEQQQVVTRQQAVEQQAPEGFSGRVEESFRGEPQVERFFVGGREVAIRREGEETFESRLQPSEKARLGFEREGVREEVLISPQELSIREQQFIPRSDSAQDLLFSGEEQQLTEREIFEGRSLPKGFREVPLTFTERASLKVRESKFGESRLVQNLAENLRLTAESMQRDRNLIEFERQSTFKDIEKVSGLPGVARATFFKLGTATGIGLEKIGVQKDIAQTTGRVFGDVALFTFFLTPTTPTTTQIQRELGEVSRVHVAGVIQQTGQRRADIQAAFNVQRAGREVKGIVEASSVRRGDLIVTGIKGVPIRKAIVFPTGKEIISKGKPFQAVQVSQVVQRERIFFSQSVGVTKTGLDKIRFVSRGASIIQDNLIRQLGATVTKTGKSISVGLFKIRTEPTTIFRVTETGARANLNQIIKSSSTAIQSANTQALQSAVASSVPIPPQVPFRVVPGIVQAFVPTKQVPQIAPTDTINQLLITKKVIPVTQVTQQIKVEQAVRQGIRNIQTQPTQQKEIQAVIQQTQQIPIQKQVSRVGITPRLLQPQPLTQRIFTPTLITPPSIITPRSPTRIFKLPKPKRARPIVPKFKGFPVFVRRRGEFKIAGFGRTPRQAVGIGKDIVGKTLAATFKVPSFKGGLVKGFRKKKEKGIFVFIEPRKQRLSTRSETGEIQKFLKQSMKGGGR